MRKKDTQQPHDTFHQHGGFSESFPHKVTIGSWLPVQNSIHDVTKFIVFDRDDVLCFLVTGGIDKGWR